MPALPTATVFDVQRFSIHDGPGIRTTVFFKGCPLRCAWCQNPESLQPRPELAFYADRCATHGECLTACPRDALSAAAGRVDRSRCDVCSECVDACPGGALEVVGREVTVEGLLAEVLADRTFYEASGGGVTLSGGEPTLQIEFVLAFAAACVAAGIPVGLQTCGAFKWEAVEPLLPSLQFVYFDLKMIDPASHAELTGADNRTILANARRLAESPTEVLFRTPVVPGLNDAPDALARIGELLSDVGARRIHLLRYHRMGEVKLPRLDACITPLGLEGDALTVAPLERAAEILTRAGLEVTT